MRHRRHVKALDDSRVTEKSPGNEIAKTYLREVVPEPRARYRYPDGCTVGDQ